MKNILKIIAFVYNFPHYKSMMGLLTLASKGIGYCPLLAVLQDKKVLRHHQSVLRYSPRDIYVPETSEVCKALKIKYIVRDHNECVQLFTEEKYDIGIVFGARILSEELISCFKYGIINMHPGLLPENRGLDNHKWAIVSYLKQGVTIHFIDKEIDRGSIIKREVIPVFLDDSLVDIHLRLQDAERRFLLDSINRYYQVGSWGEYKDHRTGTYHRAMDMHSDVQVLIYFDFYKQYYDKMGE